MVIFERLKSGIMGCKRVSVSVAYHDYSQRVNASPGDTQTSCPLLPDTLLSVSELLWKWWVNLFLIECSTISHTSSLQVVPPPSPPRLRFTLLTHFIRIDALIKIAGTVKPMHRELCGKTNSLIQLFQANVCQSSSPRRSYLRIVRCR